MSWKKRLTGQYTLRALQASGLSPGPTPPTHPGLGAPGRVTHRDRQKLCSRSPRALTLVQWRLCLSSLYDQAFDCGLIGFTASYQCVLSTELKSKSQHPYYASYFATIEGKSLRQAERCNAGPEYLQWHYEHVFKG